MGTRKVRSTPSGVGKGRGVLVGVGWGVLVAVGNGVLDALGVGVGLGWHVIVGYRVGVAVAVAVSVTTAVWVIENKSFAAWAPFVQPETDPRANRIIITSAARCKVGATGAFIKLLQGMIRICTGVSKS